MGLEKSVDARTRGCHPQKLGLHVVGYREPGGEKSPAKEMLQTLP